MTPRRSDAEIVSEVPPRMRGRLRRIGIDLEDPELAQHFAEGVRVADELTAKDERIEACRGGVEQYTGGHSPQGGRS